ncbi:MAG: hypothetical protein EPO68_01775 [Planctomycetota bacterium]|nr:MAG: hypothetical protein EPO68_01775 [Planctomycetota bacterium]
MDRRRELLIDLIEARRPTFELRAELSALPWDSPALVELRPEHIAAVLMRFVRREWSAQDVEAWADAVECRDDVRYADAPGGLVASALHELSAPEASGGLTEVSARHWLDRFRSAPT